MSFEFLSQENREIANKLKPDIPFIIEEIEGNYEEFYWKGKIKEEDVPTILKGNTLRISIYENSTLKPLHYFHNKKTYQSHSNYATYEVVYRMLHIAHVRQSIGFQTLRPTNEAHLMPVFTSEKDLYFIYNHENKTWEETDEETFQEELGKVEDLRRCKESIHVLESFLKAREDILFRYTQSQYSDIKNEKLLNYVDVMKNMATFWKDFDHITQENCVLILERCDKTLNKIQSILAGKQDESSKRTKEDFQNGLKATCIAELRALYNNRGAWIRGKRFFPNMAYLFHLFQTAEKHRDAATKLAIQRLCIELANGRNEFISFEEISFLQTCEDRKIPFA